ncbi:LysE family translocator [Rhizobium sp. TRM95796]|uniref:LysE family translocator n=1 Tax=Rhizobium sp. TRM95796 TaxID=2979862 RepID=UPI0021E6F417|nr:LysE family translocator [Rhizobium sp. TRM95796]MCV3764962.1 LysE family translocator [Rhizobium sp. TRM95796]
MTYAENLWLFFVLLTGVIAVPGMDMAFVIANSLSGGRRSGLAATAGMMAGGACHTLFGAAAVAGLTLWTPFLARPMLILGSAYMIWIGYTLTRSSIVLATLDESGRSTRRKVFFQAFITCLLNPKAWLFTLALYPQFLKPSFGPYWVQALAMGFMTVSVQLTIYGGLALAAARGRNAIAARPRLTIWLGRGAGLMLMAIALYILVRSWGDL